MKKTDTQSTLQLNQLLDPKEYSTVEVQTEEVDVRNISLNTSFEFEPIPDKNDERLSMIEEQLKGLSSQKPMVFSTEAVQTEDTLVDMDQFNQLQEQVDELKA